MQTNQQYLKYSASPVTSQRVGLALKKLPAAALGSSRATV